MHTAVGILNLLLPLIYGGLIILYTRSFFKSAPESDSLKTAVLAFTLAIHILYLFLRTILFRHPPITTPFEIMTVIAFCIALAYVYIEAVTKVKGTGMFILIPAFIFQTISSLLIRDLGDIPEILRSNLLGFHVTSALLGYSAITVGAMYGVMYLMLYHEIKSNEFGIIYNRLPNLEILEAMSFRSTLFGFIFLTVAITVGLIWLPIAYGEIFYTDPKLVGTVLIWVLYAVGLASKFLRGWHGRKSVLLYVLGFIAALFSITIVNFFLNSFHRFH